MGRGAHTDWGQRPDIRQRQLPARRQALSADSDSPLDIARPMYVEHADVYAVACTGLALHAMLLAGVLAKAGAAGISASTEIGKLPAFFIGGPSVSSCFLCPIATTVLHAARIIVRRSVQLLGQVTIWPTPAAGHPPKSAPKPPLQHLPP